MNNELNVVGLFRFRSYSDTWAISYGINGGIRIAEDNGDSTMPFLDNDPNIISVSTMYDAKMSIERGCVDDLLEELNNNLDAYVMRDDVEPINKKITNIILAFNNLHSISDILATLPICRASMVLLDTINGMHYCASAEGRFMRYNIGALTNATDKFNHELIFSKNTDNKIIAMGYDECDSEYITLSSLFDYADYTLDIIANLKCALTLDVYSSEYITSRLMLMSHCLRVNDESVTIYNNDKTNEKLVYLPKKGLFLFNGVMIKALPYIPKQLKVLNKYVRDVVSVDDVPKSVIEKHSKYIYMYLSVVNTLKHMQSVSRVDKMIKCDIRIERNAYICSDGNKLYTYDHKYNSIDIRTYKDFVSYNKIGYPLTNDVRFVDIFTGDIVVINNSSVDDTYDYIDDNQIFRKLSTGEKHNLDDLIFLSKVIENKIQEYNKSLTDELNKMTKLAADIRGCSTKAIRVGVV